MTALVVNLTNQELSWHEISGENLKAYLGGRGLGARYLYDNLSPGVDALGPENILSFWTSPLMGSGAISMVKLCGVTKSPATGTILMSLMGGYFGPELRFSGVDAVIFKGKAASPVYLLVKDGSAELRPAEHLWGQAVRQTSRALREELNLPRAQTACIGPGGENQVLFASVMNEGNAMGRGGIGAVMGSKNLKAIVASGRQRPRPVDEARLKESLRRLGKIYRESVPLKLFGTTGTTGNAALYNLKRMYPTYNFGSEGHFDRFEDVDADTLYENYVVQRVTCYGCSVRCRREAEVRDGPYAGTQTEGPEYETLWGFSGNCGINSLPAVIAANDLCLDYGLDTISASGTIAFAMECFEKSLISEQDTGGLALNFGNHEAMISVLHQIAHREGIGSVLANGTRRAAESIGGSAAELAMEVKGLELAGYDPRAAKGTALGYATSPRGGCHERGYLTGETQGRPVEIDQYTYEGKGKLVKETQDVVAVKDSLSFCVLSSAGTSLDEIAEMFSAVTGVEATVADLLEAGERICNLERLFNLREGFTRADDQLPRRFAEEPILDTSGNPQMLDLSRMLDDYYCARGWDQDGRPLEATLERLGLGKEAVRSPVLSPKQE